jgi:transposase
MLDSAVDLWATDEVHFQQHGSRCRMWIPPEIQDPILFHAPTRKSVGYFAAVRLRDGKFLFRRESGRFNAQTFFQFLLVFRQASCHPNRRVVVISDNAPYHKAVAHRAWREQHAAEFTLDFLPPYSPELNPIERVWKLTRRLCLHNRYFDALDDVTTAVEDQFNNWTDANDTLRRLCAII